MAKPLPENLNFGKGPNKHRFLPGLCAEPENQEHYAQYYNTILQSIMTFLLSLATFLQRGFLASTALCDWRVVLNSQLCCSASC